MTTILVVWVAFAMFCFGVVSGAFTMMWMIGACGFLPESAAASSPDPRDR